MREATSCLRRFWQLAPEERRLLPILALLLGLARLGVRSASVPRTRRWLAWLAPQTKLQPQRLAELSRAVGAVLPGATVCLPRAIVAEALLRKAGHAAELRIGMTPSIGRERPDAHAWVELNGQALAEDVSRYTALPVFGLTG